MTLRVLQTKQDCSKCPQITKCWSMASNTDENSLMINLLVCRLKSGIKPNSTSKLLFKLLRPKILKTAKWIFDSCPKHTLDMQHIISDVNAAIIESIIKDYRMGERAWPLHYLFNVPNGAIRMWAQRYVRSHCKYYSRTVSYDQIDSEDIEDRIDAINYAATEGKVSSAPKIATYENVHAESDTQVLGKQALAIIDDGLTLTTYEYRIIRFALSHADNGTHRVSISAALNYFNVAAPLSRKTLQTKYRSATYKILESVGLTDKVLTQRGLYTTDVDKIRRRQWILDIPQSRLTSQEISGLLNLDMTQYSLVDICWAYGVSNTRYYKLRERNTV